MDTVLRVRSRGAEQTRLIGEALGSLVHPGDLIILDGSLGAGKTTFVQGVARVLDVKGRVTSPTFIVARTHRAQATGPNLVHVDAYRLSSEEDLESVDLLDSLADSVTFVEWGRGKVEELAQQRLEIEFTASGKTGEIIAADNDCESRWLTFIPVGEIWVQRLEQLAQLLEDYRA